MENKQFEIISRKMDNMTKLLALNIIKDKAVNEQVSILTKIGFKAAEISQILDKTENQIYVTQTMLRKAKKKQFTKEKPTIDELTTQTGEHDDHSMGTTKEVTQ